MTDNTWLTHNNKTADKLTVRQFNSTLRRDRCQESWRNTFV